MKPVIKITLISLLTSGIAFNALANAGHHSSHNTAPQQTEQSAKQQIISTKGLVNEIDVKNQKLTITHDPIPSVGWPKMTMRFTYEDADMIAGIKSGQRVEFGFVQQENISLLTNISVSN